MFAEWAGWLHRHAEYWRVVKSFFRCRFWDRRPFMLSHLVTLRCNAACAFCPWNYPQEEELTTEEIRGLYREARHLGFPLNFIWGGEPLLREDLYEIARFSNSCRMSTSVFTNGYLLPDHHEFLRYCDALIVSLDAADESHDTVRGMRNLFRNAVRGIELVKRRYPGVEIFINCLLSRLNPGKIPGMMDLAQEMEVPVFFSPVLFDQGFPCGETSVEIPDMSKSSDALREDFLIIKNFKLRGHPVNNSEFSLDYFIQKKTSYRCCWPQISVTIYPGGGVEDCMTRFFLASVRRETLGQIVTSSKFRLFQVRGRRCSKACLNLDCIESSGVWDFRSDSVRNYHGVFRPKADA